MDDRTEDAVVRVRDLRMRYGTTDVLRGIDLEVRRGQVVALLGPNGAGKTTTIEILEGFRRRSGGDVEVLGMDPADGDNAWRARVGIVFQSWRDHGRWRVRDLLAHAARFYAPYTVPARPRPRDVDELLSIVGLADHATRRIKILSGGQRRRLDVAMALVGNPELLFLDEPTAGFDPQARRAFHDMIHRLSDLHDTTVLLTTHDLAEAEQLADQIFLLARGGIVASGTADELARRVSDRAEVRWWVNGTGYVHVTEDAGTFVAGLRAEHGEALADLEVRRASLEETYMALVHDEEVSA